MCKVSTEIKFCSCAGNMVAEGKSYWVFYRWSGLRDEIILGEAMLPEGVDFLTDYYNRELLRDRVNRKDTFDIDFDLQKSDRLLVAIHCPGLTSPLFYGFQFDGVEWEENAFDPFEWIQYHERAQKGLVKNSVAV